MKKNRTWDAVNTRTTSQAAGPGGQRMDRFKWKKSLTRRRSGLKVDAGTGMPKHRCCQGPPRLDIRSLLALAKDDVLLLCLHPCFASVTQPLVLATIGK